jgi:hypothetical protein
MARRSPPQKVTYFEPVPPRTGVIGIEPVARRPGRKWRGPPPRPSELLVDAVRPYVLSRLMSETGAIANLVGASRSA